MGEAPGTRETYKCYLLAMRLCALEEQAKMAHRKVADRDLYAAESFMGGVHAEAHLASMAPLAPLSGEFAKIGRHADEAREALIKVRLGGEPSRDDLEGLKKAVRTVRDDIERAM